MIDERKLLNLEKRVGQFRLQTQFIKDINNRNILSNLFKNVIVIKAEPCFWRNDIMYEALSESFDEIEGGTEAPYYEICLRDNDIVFFRKPKEQIVRILPSMVDYRKNTVEERLESI